MSDQLTPTPEAPVAPVAPEPPAAPAEPDWLPARLDRAKKSAASELLGKLGVESIDDAAALVEEARKLKEAQMTDAEKARADAEVLKAQNEELLKSIKARELTDAKRAILAEAKLPESLADILRGEDAESFKDSVSAYLEASPATAQPLPAAAGDKAQPAPLLTREQFLAMSPTEQTNLMKTEEGRAAVGAIYPKE